MKVCKPSRRRSSASTEGTGGWADAMAQTSNAFYPTLLVREPTVRKDGMALEAGQASMGEFDKQPGGWKIVGIHTWEGAGCSEA